MVPLKKKKKNKTKQADDIAHKLFLIQIALIIKCFFHIYLFKSNLYNCTLNRLDSNKTLAEKNRYELHKDVVC